MRRKSAIDRAKQLRRIERARRMTPEQRVAACLNLSEMIAGVHLAETFPGTNGPETLIVRPSGAGQPGHILLDGIELLLRLGIPYAVVGAIAVAHYGLMRATDDADVTIWLGKSPTNRTQLVTELKAAGYSSQITVGDEGVITIADQYGNELDMILGIRGMAPEALDRRVTGAVLGAPVQMIGAVDLIAMKLFAGDVQDLMDVRGILQISREQLDLELLRQVTARYGQEVADRLDRLAEGRQHKPHSLMTKSSHVDPNFHKLVL